MDMIRPADKNLVYQSAIPIKPEFKKVGKYQIRKGLKIAF